MEEGVTFFSALLFFVFWFALFFHDSNTVISNMDIIKTAKVLNADGSTVDEHFLKGKR